jgi:LmbE family N-acetylglucosaminyl deacetylase
MKIIQKGSKALLISPHPDDIEFGAGAMLHKYKEYLTTKLLVLSTRFRTRGETENKKEQELAASFLGIKDIQFFDLPIRFFDKSEIRDQIRLLTSEICKEFEPDLILIPSLNETMQDHVVVAEEITRIIKKSSILGYEVIKHNRFFRPNMFVKISQESLDAKVKALSCFKGQVQKYYFDRKVIEALATSRAANGGFLGYAEAFEVYNIIDNESHY